jgi:nucleoside-diphosphate-sugar epimerase
MTNDSTGYSNGTKDSIAFLAAASYMAGPIARHFKEAGYCIVALVRSSTDCSAIVDEGLVLEHEIHRGDLPDKEFVTTATKGCVAIINFLSQLMLPCATIKEQVENDLPPLKAALEAALEHDAIFIHTSGNFAIPPAGMNVITNELPEKPLGASLLDEESWSTFEHEGGMTAVAVLAEAKHREDHTVQDFIAQHPASKARVVIPAGIYGPSVGSKFSFWDLAAYLYLTGQFGDFLQAFVHINDAAVSTRL